MSQGVSPVPATAPRPFRAAILAIAGAVLCFSATPGSAEPLKLRVADTFPTGHYLSRFIIQPFMAEVTTRTNGAVTFEYFPSQQLGKAADMLTLTQTGVANIALVSPGYIADKMPLSEAAMLPGSFRTPCEGTKAYWQVAQSGVIAANDYAANRVRPLMAIALPAYQVMTVKAPVNSVEDLRGLKLRATGGAQDLTLRMLGAVPIRMAAPDMFESLSRGTVDGLLFTLDSVATYNLEKTLRFSTVDASFSSFVVTYAISSQTWSGLPEDVRRVMSEVADEVMPAACAAIEKQDAESRRQLEAAGIRLAPIPAEAQAKFDAILQDVGAKWAEGLDARGRKGTAALREFREADERVRSGKK